MNENLFVCFAFDFRQINYLKKIKQTRGAMYSRFIFRSVQGVSSLSTFTRFLSLTQIQSTAATKLKENTSIGASSEKFAAKTECSSAKETSNVPSEEKTPIPPPTSSTQDPNKTYSEKIHRLVDEISKLSLVDVRDLNELLKVIFEN